MKYFITSILLLNCYLLHAQTQLGSDIDGEAADDQSGWSVSMNSAGDRVPLGQIGMMAQAVMRVTSGSMSTVTAAGHSWAET